ncbi:MAG: UDP-N-acetylmuramate--L-alanine ligase [Acidobacteria bacterium]|nr:MAG: UDP-N-acetylmuramate--L-alanine ligase [Acidobacteriota bacterium]
MLGKVRKIHFVGIGGIGMSGLAEVLLNLGFSVSGSDIKQTPVTDRLSQLGARIACRHSAENIGDAEVVVVSSAVPVMNPEIIEAAHRKIPVIPRAEMLAELMRLKFCVAVAGSHGKTTVTSMVAVMLSDNGLDPTAVIGGRLDVFGSSARLGKSELMVVEADESDRSFLYLMPTLAVVTNIDREHLDHYGDLGEIQESFVSFMNKVPFYGAVIACVDPPWRASMQAVLPRLRRRVVTYGIQSGADVTARDLELRAGGSSFEVAMDGKSIGSFKVNIPGRHNVQNALAAIAVGRELDLEPAQIQTGLKFFHGADRRFQVKAEVNGITIVDDYGHHPTEISATLEAARLRGARRIRVVFQPHRYSRTKFLMDEFARCFDGCDRVYLLDIYPASEAPIPGITSQRLVERMSELGFTRARYFASESAVTAEILADLHPGDLVLTIGAGPVWKIAETLAKAVNESVEHSGTVKN